MDCSCSGGLWLALSNDWFYHVSGAGASKKSTSREPHWQNRGAYWSASRLFPAQDQFFLSSNIRSKDSLCVCPGHIVSVHIQQHKNRLKYMTMAMFTGALTPTFSICSASSSTIDNFLKFHIFLNFNTFLPIKDLIFLYPWDYRNQTFSKNC